VAAPAALRSIGIQKPGAQAFGIWPYGFCAGISRLSPPRFWKPCLGRSRSKSGIGSISSKRLKSPRIHHVQVAHADFSELDSFHAWKAFATAYPGVQNVASLRKRKQIIEQPNMALSLYVNPLSASEFQWITFLTLSNITCSRPDLINLSKLSNIGALTIGPGVEAPEFSIDDRLLRAWAHAAEESNSFSMLRVLMCRYQDQMSTAALEHLTRFPALAVFGVEACSIGSGQESAAQTLGWGYRAGAPLGRFLLEGGATESDWPSVLDACFSQGSRFCIEAATAEGVDAISSLPIVDFSVGAVPVGASVESMDEQNLQCFFRNEKREHIGGRIEDMVPGKRPLDERAGAESTSKKTPKLSKRYSYTKLIPEFGI
jgi:hypothetical protein